MKKYSYFLILSLITVPQFLFARGIFKDPAVEFTVMMSIAAVAVIGLWILVWWRRSKQKK